MYWNLWESYILNAYIFVTNDRWIQMFYLFLLIDDRLY